MEGPLLDPQRARGDTNGAPVALQAEGGNFEGTWDPVPLASPRSSAVADPTEHQSVEDWTHTADAECWRLLHEQLNALCKEVQDFAKKRCPPPTQNGLTGFFAPPGSRARATSAEVLGRTWSSTGRRSLTPGDVSPSPPTPSQSSATSYVGVRSGNMSVPAPLSPMPWQSAYQGLPAHVRPLQLITPRLSSAQPSVISGHATPGRQDVPLPSAPTMACWSTGSSGGSMSSTSSRPLLHQASAPVMLRPVFFSAAAAPATGLRPGVTLPSPRPPVMFLHSHGAQSPGVPFMQAPIASLPRFTPIPSSG